MVKGMTGTTVDRTVLGARKSDSPSARSGVVDHHELEYLNFLTFHSRVLAFNRNFSCSVHLLLACSLVAS